MLRMSTLFLRTLREDPADAEVPSHRLLVRAGYVRRVAPGIYSWLPLGLKVLRNIERVVREEMDAMGGQEVQFPALLVVDGADVTADAASLSKVSVAGEIVAATKGPKIIIHKFKNKTGYHKRQGHRQPPGKGRGHSLSRGRG